LFCWVISARALEKVVCRLKNRMQIFMQSFTYISIKISHYMVRGADYEEVISYPLYVFSWRTL